MQITIVEGTARSERQSIRVARSLEQALLENAEATVQFVDVADYVHSPLTIPAWVESELYQPWREIAMATDVFVFVLPEYNHGYPGEWKLLMDSAYEEYAGKAAYLVGVSGGSFAGVRVVDHVMPVLVELGLQVHKEALFIGHVAEQFDERGELRDAATAERLQKFAAAVANISV